MMLDPTLAAAIVAAAGGLLQKLLELWGNSPADKKTAKVLSQVYGQVADAVSPNSLRVLLVLREVGSFQLPEQLVVKAQALATRQEPSGKPFETDITYRLRYLCLLGLVAAGASDFALTQFGAAFIEHARGDKFRYGNVFIMLGP